MAWPTQFFHSLRFRLLAASITIELLLLSLLLGNSIRLIDASMRASIDVSLQQNVTLLNVATAPYLLQGDYATLTDNLTEIIGAAREDGIVYAVVLDNDGRTAAFAGPIEPSRLPAPQASLDQALRDTVLHVVKPARLANRTVGELHFGLSTLRMAQARRDVIQQGLLIAGFVVFASLILLGLSAYWLTNRLASLARSSRAIAAGNYTLQLPERGRDEVAQLSGSFNEMRRSIQQQLNELGANELEYRALFEQAAVGMGHLCIDDGHWLRANNKLCLLLNQPPEAFTRQTIFDIALEEDRERLREARHALLQGEIDVFETDCQLRRSDGSLLWCTVTASLYRKPGGTAGYFILLVQDVSARKANEIELDQYRESLEQRVAQRTADLAAANNELRAFSYSVSHDLRAPLRSIDGFSHMLEEDYGDRLDDIARGYMGRIRAAAQRMGSLIDAMLNLAKVTRAELQPKLVDLSALARGIVDDLQAGQPARTVEVDIEGWLYAWGDEELLRSAMQNLLGNAWKYSARREQARIEFGRLFAEDGPVFFVRDNGAGFDARYADKLFAPFQRLHSASDFDGIGVGLASVQRVVQRHAGRIWAEAEPDKGATFFFTLRIEPELSAANSADTHTQAGTPP